MKRLVIAILLFLLIICVAQARFLSVVEGQGPIFLPTVIKGEACNMWAVLEVSDGETTVSLLKGHRAGFHLKDWNPTIIQPKGGGVFQDSPQAAGRRLVYAVDSTAIESFDLIVNNFDQNGIIIEAQNLMRLLLKARAFDAADWQDSPVWVRARANCEDNARYARIITYTIPQLDNPYGQPFFTASQIAAMDDISLSIERDHWLALPPGQGACVEVAAQQEWDFQATTIVRENGLSQDGEVLITATNGYMYMGDADGQVWRSTDNGLNWSVVTAALGAGNVVLSLIELRNGYILAGSGSVIRSTDNGDNWAVVTAAPTSVEGLAQTLSGKVLLTDGNGDVYQSSDNGGSWSLNTSVMVSNKTRGIIVARNGNIIIADWFKLWISTDDAVNWIQIGTFQFSRFALLSSGDIIAISDTFHISRNNGLTWQILTIFNTGAGGIISVFQDSRDTIYAGTSSGEIFISTDGGLNFYEYITGSGQINSLTEAADGDIFFVNGNELDIVELVITDYSPGQEATCANGAYIANKQPISNLTHIKISDGGVFSTIGLPMTLPADLFPAVPAANDALYLGTDTALALVPTGPFTGLVFDLLTSLTPAATSATITLVWEYWNGAAWTTLITRDNTALVDPLDQLGVVSVHWEPPADWATTAVDGVTGYWVRLRVSAISGTWSPPEQQNRDIYAIVTPFVEVAAGQVLGDIPAISRIKIQSQSDGDDAANPQIPINRVVAGLRSTARGEGFQAYINISDEQNPDGITVTVSTNTTFGADILAPSGRAATYNPAAGEGMVTRATIAFDSSIARDFYGDFHVFLRVTGASGSEEDLFTQLQFATGSGGILLTTPTVRNITSLPFAVLDYGQVGLPVSGSFKQSELPDTMEIRIRAGSDSGTPTLTFYDLIMIPVDEWAVDAVDQANILNASVLGRVGGITRILDIDSLYPKVDIRTLIRQVSAGELIAAEWNPITGGPAILQANATQRLWFLAINSDGAANPAAAHTVTVEANYRYLGMRGNR